MLISYSINVIAKTITCCLFLVVFISSAQAQKYLVPETIEKLKSSDPEVRAIAAGQLAALRDENAPELLLAMLNDPDDNVRAAVVTGLGWLKDTRAVQPILGLIYDNNSQVRFKAVWALGMIGDAQAVEPLIKIMLEDANPSMKYEAAESLGKLKDARAVEPLIQMLRVDMVGKAAEEALVQLGPLAVERFCQMLVTNDNSWRQWYASTILKKIADERAIKPLISVLGIRHSGIGTNAAEALAWRIGSPAIDELLIALDDKSPDVRNNAVWALGGIRDERVIAPLLSAVDDENSEVRLTALKVISNFEDGKVTQRLLAALDDVNLWEEASLMLGEKKNLESLPYLIKILKGDNPEKAVRAHRSLFLLGKPAVDDLIAVLLDKNPDFPKREIVRQQELNKQNQMFRCGNEPPPPTLDPRRLAAVVLGAIGDERAIKPLRQVLNDKSTALRNDAANALKRLESLNEMALQQNLN